MLTITPEQHTDELMAAIERELITYGAASLADVIASVASAYADDDDYSASAQAWRRVGQTFEELVQTLPMPALPRPAGAMSAVVQESTPRIAREEA